MHLYFEYRKFDPIGTSSLLSHWIKIGEKDRNRGTERQRQASEVGKETDLVYNNSTCILTIAKYIIFCRILQGKNKKFIL